MKKMYIDKLEDSTGENDFMIRGKGLTTKSIIHAATKYNNDVMKLYEHLYNKNNIKFDLTYGQPCFDMNKNMSVSTRTKFMRTVEVKYDEGEIDKYFSYASVNL